MADVALPPLPEGATLDVPAELPPLPEGATLDAPQELPPLPEGATLDAPAEEPAAAPSSTPSPMQPAPAAPDYFTADDIHNEVQANTALYKRNGRFERQYLAPYQEPTTETPEARAARREEEDALVRKGFGVALYDGTLTDKQKAEKVANYFGIPDITVAQNLPQWLDTYAKASGDPRRWIEENPLAAALVFSHPERADEVVSHREVNVAMKALNTALDFTEWAIDSAAQKSKELAPPQQRPALTEEQARAPLSEVEQMNIERQGNGAALKEAQAKAAAEGRPVTRGDLRAALDAADAQPPLVEDFTALKAKDARDNPEVTQRDSAAAQQMRARNNVFEMAGQRGKEARAQLGLSVMWRDRALAVMRGQDTSDIDNRIAEKEADATPLLLNESPAQRIVTESWGQSRSTWEVMKQGGTAAAVAGVAVAGVTAAAQRTGPGAFISKTFGISPVNAGLTAARWAGGAGAAKATFDLEFGDSYKSLLQTKRDDGMPLTEREAIGGAVIAATVKTGVELVELNAIRKALGPAGAALGEGGLEAVKRALATNPGFRAMAADAAKAWAGEAVEEVVQGGVDDVTNYATRSLSQGIAQKGPVFDVQSAKENFVGGLLRLPIAAGALVFQAGTRAVLQDRQHQQTVQASALADFASNKEVTPFASQVAELVAAKTGQSGAPVTHVYVDAEAFKSYFQTELEAEKAATELLGEDGPQKLAKAVAGDGQLQVSVEDYVRNWGPVAKALSDDTAVQPGGLTPRQQVRQAQSIAEEAKRIAEAEKSGESGVSETLDRFNELEAQLRAVPGVTADDAKKQLAPLRSVFTTLAKRFGQSVDELFRNVRLTIDDGTHELNIAVRNANASQQLSAELAQLTPEEKASRLFVDGLTGGYNFSGWQEMQAQDKAPAVSVLTLADVKPVNDAELGGHDSANALLAHIAPAVAAVDARFARKGTNFIFRGGEAELQRALEGVRGLLPAGMQVRGATGATVEEALKANDSGIDAERAAAAEAVKRGEVPTISPDRASSLADVTQLPEWERAWQAAAAARVAQEATGERAPLRVTPTPSQQAYAAGLAPEAYFREAYVDKEVPSVLSKAGWDAIPRKAFVASIDMKGLKLANENFGKEVGDTLLRAFMERAAAEDGSDFDFAHLSGDEFAAQADSADQLQGWLDNLTSRLGNVGVEAPKQAPDGTIKRVRISPQFRSGIGEKTYGAADRVLNAAKRLEQRRGSGNDHAGGSAPAGGAGSQVLPGRQGAGGQREDAGGNQGGSSAAAQPGGSADAGRAVVADNSAGRAGGEAVRQPGPGGGQEARGGAGQAAPGVADAVAPLQRRKAEYRLRGAPYQAFIRGQHQQRVVELAQKQKGRTDIGTDGSFRVYRVALLKAHDASTFLHESGHVFLDIFGQLAARADAPESIRNDWQTTLDWLGVASGADIGTAQHEKWAAGFERYFAEGKAPAARLEGPFRRFRLWLGNIYRQLSVLGDLSPAITGVFDRLLATDAEIDANTRAMGLEALPQDVLGLDAKEYQQYLDDLAEATGLARQQADLAVARAKLRETEAWWKQQRAEFKRQAGEEYEALPARRMQLMLRGQPVGDFLGIDQPLHRATVEAWLGEEAAKKFRLAKDGLHPDDLAEADGYALGFGDGRSLVTAVAELPEKSTYVEARADQEMVANFPDVLDDRQALRELVQRGLHNNLTKEWALKEWAALTAMQRKQLRDAAAADVPRPPPPEVLQQAAKLLAAGTPAGHLRQASVLAAERKAAGDALKAAKKGDFGAAAAFKQKQILNMYLFRELQQAQRDVERLTSLAGRLQGTTAQARLAKATILNPGDRPVLQEAVNALLGAFGLGDAAPATGALSGLLQQAQQVLTANLDSVMFDADALEEAAGKGLLDWRDMSIETARNLLAALENINAGARNRAEILSEGRRVSKETARNELRAEAAKALPEKEALPTPEARNIIQRLKAHWMALDGAMLKTETMVEMLAGTKDTAAFVKSAWYRYLIQPMQEAKVRAADLTREVLEPLVKAFEDVPAEAKRRWNEALPPDLFPTHIAERVPQRRWEILMMLLNSGNESNLQRLTEGRGITEQQLRDAAQRVGITQEEYAWVQGVWDAAEKLKPLSFDLEQQDSGVLPEEIPARPFETPFGVMRGGYFPAVYDRVVSKLGDVKSLQDLRDASYTRPATSHGFLKQRTDGFTDVISLSPSSITRHFSQVIHDVAFRQAIKSVGSLLVDPETKQVLRRHLGEGRAEQFSVWLRDVALQRGVSANDGLKWMADLNSAARANVSVAVLGFSIRNAAEDFTSNIASALAASDLKAQHLTAATAELTMSPAETRKMVLEKSGELRSRQKSLQRELQEQISKLSHGWYGKAFRQGPLGFMYEHAFALSEAVEVATGTPIWLGAYRQALGDGLDEKHAVEVAETTVRKVLVTRNLVDVSTLMRNKGAIGSMLMFFGAFNHFWNQFRGLAAQALLGARQGDTAHVARTAGRTLGLSIGLWLIGPLSRGQGPEPEEPLEQWLLRKMVLEGYMQLVPGLNEIGNYAASRMLEKRHSVRNNSLVGVTERFAEDAVKAATTDDTGTRVRALLGMTGTATGLPVAAPARQLGPVFDWLRDDNQWRNPLDAASDVMYGRQDSQPWNVPQAISDAVEGGPR